MSHNVILHTKVEISHQAKSAMGDLPRRDRRLLKCLLRRLRNNSLFKVFQIPAKPETQSEFVKGRAWLHTLHSSVAIFKLKGAVLHLVDLLLEVQEYKIMWLEFVVIREMNNKYQHKQSLRYQSVPDDRYKYRLP